jgi:ABC-2 type transport system ATP-binding protein
VAIRLEHVAKRFGSVDVLRDLSWEVLQGHIVGLLGLNGAGKTTLLRLLLGMLRRSEGSAMVAGVVLDGPSADVRQRVGYVPERSHIPGNFTPDRLEAVGRETFSAWDAEHYDGVLQHFRIGRNKPMFLMSQGQRILTSLAFSLAHHAEILLLDEPTNGLDPDGAASLLAMMAEPSDVTIVMASHRVDEVAEVCDFVWEMKDGRLSALAPASKPSERRQP